MAVWSRLFWANDKKLFNPNGLLGKLTTKNKNTFQNQAGVIRCMSGHHTMDIVPSRWQWHKTKDWMHFYFFVGAIPAALIIFYTNVFIGPATLEPIPEGYRPKPWEYYRHPISRFLARYCYPNQQQEYEKLLHYVETHYEMMRIRELKAQVKLQMRDHNDDRYYYYSPNMSSVYIKAERRKMEELKINPQDTSIAKDLERIKKVREDYNV